MLSDKVPPGIEGVLDKTIIQGEDLVFVITPTGWPLPDLEWFVGDTPLDVDVDKTEGDEPHQTVTIKSLMNPGVSQLTVRAHSSAGDCQREATLTIKGSYIHYMFLY